MSSNRDFIGYSPFLENGGKKTLKNMKTLLMKNSDSMYENSGGKTIKVG